MLDSILNKIAERSQALKEKDAELATWMEMAESLEGRNVELAAQVEGMETPLIAELRASMEQYASTAREANRRAEVAESQLRDIADALDIPVGAVELPAEDGGPAAMAVADAKPDAPVVALAADLAIEDAQPEAEEPAPEA